MRDPTPLNSRVKLGAVEKSETLSATGVNAEMIPWAV
jgi:hypothetical protein